MRFNCGKHMNKIHIIEKTQSVSVTDHFASVENPRIERTPKRKSGDIIATAMRQGNRILAISLYLTR